MMALDINGNNGLRIRKELFRKLENNFLIRKELRQIPINTLYQNKTAEI